MDFLGIGPLEIFAIFLIALIVLGPGELVDTGKKLGSLWRDLRDSSIWQGVQGSRRAMNKMARELIETDELEKLRDELSKARIVTPYEPVDTKSAQIRPYHKQETNPQPEDEQFGAKDIT